MPRSPAKTLSESDISRLIEMAWEDRTPFDAIEQSFGLSESQVIALMRAELKRGSFELWRKRVTGRATKHMALRSKLVERAYCPTQYKHK
ncbi:TIGR03643 family protein [Polynucleobacter sp. UK-Kesae-W10]|uniref:TIGR03643 family protein n=1 Tax=Polynucleobacter sp. UK-Kesae-W10 TaxID=1819738 RepID=UPI001C0AE536|nr:TIGR03643 family protein [Polynucleobacter sp. UK-Kesae-W10]